MLIELSREGRDFGGLDVREEIAAILIVVSIATERQLYHILTNIKPKFCNETSAKSTTGKHIRYYLHSLIKNTVRLITLRKFVREFSTAQVICVYMFTQYCTFIAGL
jgi:hypothetical protein